MQKTDKAVMVVAKIYRQEALDNDVLRLTIDVQKLYQAQSMAMFQPDHCVILAAVDYQTVLDHWMGEAS